MLSPSSPTSILDNGVLRMSLGVSAWGVKLLCILVIWQQILMYFLSDGSSVDRLWLGGCCLLVSFGFCADISLHLCFVDSTSDVLGGFNHLLKSLPVLSHAWTMPVCDVFSQNAFYCSSVKVDHNLAPNLVLFKNVSKINNWLLGFADIEQSLPICTLILDVWECNVNRKVLST